MGEVLIAFYVVLSFFLLHGLQVLSDYVCNIPIAPYAPGGHLVFKSFADYASMPRLIFGHMTAISLSCVEDAPLNLSASLRVVVYCHGLGGTCFMYSKTCARLASLGYLVLVPEFGDGTSSLSILPDGSHRTYAPYEGQDPNSDESRDFRFGQLKQRAGEIRESLDTLALLSGSKDPSEGRGHSYSPRSRSIVLRFSDRPGGMRTVALSAEGAVAEADLQGSRLLRSLQGSRLLDRGPPLVIGHSFGGATAAYLLMHGGIHGQDQGPADTATSIPTAAGDKKNVDNPDDGDSDSDSHGVIRLAGVVLLDAWYFPISKLVADATVVDDASVTDTVSASAAAVTTAPSSSDGSSSSSSKEEVAVMKLALPEEVTRVPLLAIHAGLFQWDKNLQRERALVAAMKTHVQALVKDAGHYIYTDIGLLSPLLMALLRKGGRGDPQAQQDRINDTVEAFASAVFRGKPLHECALVAGKISTVEILNVKID
jgi:pimeloyl-ACP methyl ester carboxylesterase